MRSRKYTFGISIEPTWNLDRSVALAKLAERLGFSNVWVPDGGPAPPFSDAIVTLAAIVSNTKRIKFGSAILNFYTRNPAMIASSFRALSNLSSDPKHLKQRAVLGIGVGSSYNVAKVGIFDRSGVIDELREAIESVRDLFEGKEVSVRTDAYAIERVTLSKARGRIPIYIGSQSPKGLRLAGEIADGVILTNRIASQIEESMKHLTLGLSDGQRERKDIEVVNSVVVSVSDNRSRARQAAKPTCAYLVAWLDDETASEYKIDENGRKKISKFVAAGDESSASKFVDDKMLDLLTVCGKPQECVEKCREHLNHGVDQIAFCEPFGPNPFEAITQIARRVVPRL
ncbi:MAG: LLM class flavin-dependent oxidoreductase [Nitrososphaerales archaeon]